MATELVAAMKDFNVSQSVLLEMYRNETESGADANPYQDAALNASEKSIKSKVAASRDLFAANTVASAELKADFEEWLIAQTEEVFPRQNELASPGMAGQIADGSNVRYVSGKGLEYDQAVAKSLIGALMLDQIVNNYISTSVLDADNQRAENDRGEVESGKPYTTMEHKWDEAYGYLFGATADAARPMTTLGTDDNFLNRYLGRVDNDPDFAGIAQSVFEAFKLGRAAIVAGAYDVRDEQAERIRELLSRVIAIRAVYYLQQAKIALPDNGGNDYGPAFHDLSEGFGFIYSLRFTRRPNSSEPYFSSEEVEEMLSQLTAGNGFWDVTPQLLDALSQRISDRFDFTVAQAGE